MLFESFFYLEKVGSVEKYRVMISGEELDPNVGGGGGDEDQDDVGLK